MSKGPASLVLTGALLLACGALTFFVASRIDFGFVMGLFQGVALALVAGGLYLFVSAWRYRDDRRSGLWLPSRDGSRRERR